MEPADVDTDLEVDDAADRKYDLFLSARRTSGVVCVFKVRCSTRIGSVVMRLTSLGMCREDIN